MLSEVQWSVQGLRRGRRTEGRSSSPVICRNRPCSLLGWEFATGIMGADAASGVDCVVASARGCWAKAWVENAAAGDGGAGAAVTPWHMCDSDRPAANSIALAAMVGLSVCLSIRSVGGSPLGVGSVWAPRWLARLRMKGAMRLSRETCSVCRDEECKRKKMKSHGTAKPRSEQAPTGEYLLVKNPVAWAFYNVRAWCSRSAAPAGLLCCHGLTAWDPPPL